MDLFEVGKKDFLTTTCKLSGLILGENLANKSAEETCKKVESLFLRNGPPLKIITDNGMNFTSKKFQALMEKYGVEHARCSPHYHQGSGIAEKLVDTLKHMIQKVPKATISEACFKLNNMIRPGSKATPLSFFFGRHFCGHLLNQFNKECKIKETIQKGYPIRLLWLEDKAILTMMSSRLETEFAFRTQQQEGGVS